MSAPNSGYNLSRQLDLVAVTIKKPDFPDQEVDIKDAMEEIIIYEDIFQQSITAKIVIKDQINLVGVLPIVGGEIIRFKYRTPIYDNFIEHKMVVYKIGDREIDTDSSNIQVTTLFLCTLEMWWATSNDISIGIKGPYSDMITKLLNLYPGTKKNFDKEDTAGVFTYAVPNISMFRAIRFCASRSLNENYAPYFFWETAHGYHLKNLKTLYDTAAVKSIYIGDKAVYGQDIDPEKVFNTTTSYEYLSSNDRLHQNIQMDFGGKFFILDFTTKQLSVKDYDYSQSFTDKNVHLEGFPLNDDTKSFRSKIGYINTNPDNSHLSEWYDRSLIDFIGNNRLVASIPGDSELKAGDTIWIKIPSKVGHEVEDELHTSGKFLVTSIKHLIQKDTYAQIIELSKDSFAAKVRQNEVSKFYE